jgi:hypothetical protein
MFYRLLMSFHLFEAPQIVLEKKARDIDGSLDIYLYIFNYSLMLFVKILFRLFVYNNSDVKMTFKICFYHIINLQLT